MNGSARPGTVGIFIEGEARGGWEAGNERRNDNDDGLFSVLVLGRMKDEFADFDLEPKMQCTIALFLLPPQLQYSKDSLNRDNCIPHLESSLLIRDL